MALLLKLSRTFLTGLVQQNYTDRSGLIWTPTLYHQQILQLRACPTFSLKEKVQMGARPYVNDKLCTTVLWVPVVYTSFVLTLTGGNRMTTTHIRSLRPIMVAPAISRYTLLILLHPTILKTRSSIAWLSLTDGRWRVLQIRFDKELLLWGTLETGHKRNGRSLLLRRTARRWTRNLQN